MTLAASPAQAGTSLRRTLFLRLGGLIAVVTLLITILFVTLGLSPLTDRLVESQFTVAALRVETTLATTFLPVEEVLRVSRAQAGDSAPPVDRPDEFNRQFRPVLESLPQATSVVAGTSSGEGWLLLHSPDGRWHNRLTNVGRWGRRQLMYDFLPDGQHSSEWREVDYDARRRPWYREAMAGAPGSVHWTKPYLFFTTGDPGITVSTRLTLADGRDYVIGFDLMLRDLSQTTMASKLGKRGLSVVLTDDGRVLALPAAPAGTRHEDWLAKVLKPVAELGVPAVADALKQWNTLGRQNDTGLITYRTAGEQWLARRAPYQLSGQRLWIVTAAPAADFSPDWTPLIVSLAAAALLTMILALLLVARQVRHIASPLESLAANVRQLADGETNTRPRPASRINEVNELADFQEAMAGTIQRDQAQLASQADQLRQQLREIRQLAYFDPITALPNRRLLLDRLSHTLLARRRSRDFGALLMLDLDHFKVLNDTLGHEAGDKLLVQVAQRLRACVRQEDTVSRLGGDEYVVMLESLGGQAQGAAGQAEAIAEKIRGSLNQPYALPGGPSDFHTSASLGIVLFDGQDGGSAEALLKQADMALYKAKDAGRNTIRFYSPAMQAAIDEQVRLESGLRQALAQGELVLHYQPQVDIDGRIVALEALVRWQHPKDGLIMPDRFVPVAERTGQIFAVGEWVLNEACRQLAAWKAKGIVSLRMAVNLSARQLHAPGLEDTIAATLERHGLAAGDLELEITETAALQDPEEAIALLRTLQNRGIHLAVDDFGTGYSSLSYLSRLPVQTLKLDKSFVHGIESSDSQAAICAATIALAHNLELQVVAEGVETEAQRYFLAQVHGCDLLQGYLFGRPQPAAALTPQLQATGAALPAPR